MAKRKNRRLVDGGSVQASEEGRIVRANLIRRVVRSATFASLYANDTQVQLSPWDIRFTFGVISDVSADAGGSTVVIDAVGEVRMSPQHAKKVAMILLRQLEVYEAKIGPIPLPND